MGEKILLVTRRIRDTVFRYRILTVTTLLLVSTTLLGPWTYAIASTASVRYDGTKVTASQVPKEPVAIVFGARVNGKSPTPYLRFRVEAAADLYKAGRVHKLLVTGDNSLKNYDEPAVMRQAAIDLGVKPADITVDDAGFSTYDSCYRAKHIFKVDRAVLVTQNYHLPRAVFACQGVGIESIGYGARATEPLLVMQYTAREWLSTGKIVIQLVTHAQSRLLGDAMPIDAV